MMGLSGNRLVKIPGPAGTILSGFLRVFYVVFLFPLCAKLFEGRARAAAHTA